MTAPLQLITLFDRIARQYAREGKTLVSLSGRYENETGTVGTWEVSR